MNKTLLKVLVVLLIPLLTNCIVSANYLKLVEGVFEKNGNIYISYNDNSSSRITDLKADNSPQLSCNKKFIVFLRKVVDVAIKPSEDNLDARYPILLIYYDISSKMEKILAKSCTSVMQIADKYSSTTIEDGDKVLCDFTNPIISLDNKRVYFESFSGITGNHSIDYVDLSTLELHYFTYGHLVSIEPDGNFKIVITKVEIVNGVSQGRQWKTWLYDKHGKPIRIIEDDSYGNNPLEKVTAEEIVMYYQINEKRANKRFLNKVTDITGVVLEAKKDISGKYTLTLKSNDKYSSVFCSLSDKQKTFSSLQNKSITIRGTVTGFLSDVVVNNGIIIKVN